MAHEVIDLLSSPDPAPRRIVTIKNKPSSAPSKSTPPTNECISILSFDDESPDNAIASKASRSPKPASGKRSISKSASTDMKSGRGVYFYSDDFDTTVDLDTSSNQPQYTNNDVLGLNRKQMEEERLLRANQKKEREGALLDGANDKPASSNTNSKPPYIPFPRPSFSSSIFDKQPETLVPSCRTGGEPRSRSMESYVTADLDDPFAFDLPPAKKRRVSRSPRALSPNPTVPKASSYKRSISYFETSSRPGAPKMKIAGFQRSSTASKKIELDPIVFTSSPDHVADAKRKKNEKKKGKDIFDKDSDDPFADRPPSKSKSFPIDSDSDPDSDGSLPDLHAIRASNPAPKAKAKRPQTGIEKYEAHLKREKTAEKQRSEKSQKEKEKQAAKEGKYTEQERKRMEKQEKAQEKQRAAELEAVNKLKTDKKKSALEMIVHLPDSLNPKLASQTHAFFENHGIEKTEYESLRPIIKWQRKVVAAFNQEKDHWETVDRHIEDVKHVLYIMSAKEFVDLATGDEGDELDLHVVQLKSEFDSCKIIYLIEGLESWKKKNRTTKERQFKDAVRYQAGHEEPATNQRAKKKKKQEADYVDEDAIEDALVKLQMHQTLIHHTEAMQLTAEWILTFTQHISTIPYKSQASSHDTAFCMDSGQIKAGINPSDTFNRMLQENLRITAPIAYGIMAEYPTVQQLIQGFEKEGPLALAECRTSANKDGAFTDRRVGPAISKRLHSVFTGRDPDSWSV